MEWIREWRDQRLLMKGTAVFSMFALGYVLLIGIDKIAHPTLNEVLISGFTVYTQLGILIFPILYMSSVANDYKEQTILFYRRLGYTPFKYLIEKFIVNFLVISGCTVLSLVFLTTIYGDYSKLGTSILLIEAVIFYQLTLSLLLVFIFGKLMVAYLVNVFLWIGGMFLALVHPFFEYLVYYDAVGATFQTFDRYLAGQSINIGGVIGQAWLYNVIFLIVACGFVALFKRQWLRNGV